MVVTVLYFFGGPGIHAFAFSLVIGVISGTYSSIYVAAPLTEWIDRKFFGGGGATGVRKTSTTQKRASGKKAAAVV